MSQDLLQLKDNKVAMNDGALQPGFSFIQDEDKIEAKRTAKNTKLNVPWVYTKIILSPAYWIMELKSSKEKQRMALESLMSLWMKRSIVPTNSKLQDFFLILTDTSIKAKMRLCTALLFMPCLTFTRNDGSSIYVHFCLVNSQ